MGKPLWWATGLALAAILTEALCLYLYDPVTITGLRTDHGFTYFHITNSAKVPVYYFSWKSEKHGLSGWERGSSDLTDEPIEHKIDPGTSIDVRVPTSYASQGAPKWRLGITYSLVDFSHLHSGGYLFATLIGLVEDKFRIKTAWSPPINQ
jgi:hypothetical protein